MQRFLKFLLFLTSLTAIGLIWLVAARPAEAVELRPLFMRNLMPQKLLFGLPPMEGGDLSGVRSWKAKTTFDIANTYSLEAEEDEAEQLLFDAETYRLALQVRYGLLDWLEVGAEVPLLGHAGGFLDNFIERFHTMFRFPKGDRVDDETNKLEFRYSDDREELFEFHRSGYGLGDIQLGSAVRLLSDPSPDGGALALRFSLKLPTGDSDRWRGSGGTDLSLLVDGTKRFHAGEYPMALFGSIGGAWLGEGDILSSRQREVVGVAGCGLAIEAMPSLALQIQLDGHTPLYKHSGLREIGSGGLQFTLGGRYQLSERLVLDIGVGEDIIVHSAPDVVFHFALTTLF